MSFVHFASDKYSSPQFPLEFLDGNGSGMLWKRSAGRFMATENNSNCGGVH